MIDKTAKSNSIWKKLQCKGSEGRVEGAQCSLCETNHTLTYELLEEVLDSIRNKLLKESCQKIFKGQPVKGWDQYDCATTYPSGRGFLCPICKKINKSFGVQQ